VADIDTTAPETPQAGRFLSDVTREAFACLGAAEDILCNYGADDPASSRLHRIGRAQGLIEAAATVLRSLELEGVRHD